MIELPAGVDSGDEIEIGSELEDGCWNVSISLGETTILIALTGWGQEDDRKKTAEAGFDHHLVTPAEPAMLRDLLARLDLAEA